MARADRNRLEQLAVLALGLVFLFAVSTYAADPPFEGKWKGESRPPAATGTGAPGPGRPAASGPGGGTPTGGATAAAPARGGGGGSAGVTRYVPQKVSLNLKLSKDNKVSGNITLGENDTSDLKEGKVDGNILTFKAGRSPSPTFDYKAEMKDGQMFLTSSRPAMSPDGRSARTEYVLTKK